MTGRDQPGGVGPPTAFAPTTRTVADMAGLWVGSFVAIATIGLVAEHHDLGNATNLALIGSFGAAAVLLFAAPTSPFAQPRAVVGGNLLSALIGVTAFQLVGDHTAVAAALAVATAITVMQLTRTIHPPGGATALIAVIGGPRVTDLGYAYVLSPVLTGVAILMAMAWVVHHRPTRRGGSGRR